MTTSRIFTNQEVLHFRAQYSARQVSQGGVARAKNCNISAARHMLTGRTYAHVGGVCEAHNSGGVSPFTLSQKADMFNQRQGGATYNHLAKQYGCSNTTIRKWVKWYKNNLNKYD